VQVGVEGVVAEVTRSSRSPSQSCTGATIAVLILVSLVLESSSRGGGGGGGGSYSDRTRRLYFCDDRCLPTLSQLLPPYFYCTSVYFFESNFKEKEVGTCK